MPRYTLTKNYLEIAESYGLFQNLSANSDIEITENVDAAGIILKPFHTAIINQKVYARKIGNAGSCPLAVLPFQKLCENPTAIPPLSIRDLVSVSKDSLGNQNKFLIQFDDKTGR